MMGKFKIIIEDLSEKMIQEIEMSEMIEGEVMDNDIIEKYLIPIITQLQNGIEYIVKIRRIANNDFIIAKSIRRKGDTMVFT